MIRAAVPGESRLALLGVVRGLVQEATELRAALEEIHPGAVGLGLSVEEAQSLTEHFVGSATEPFVPLLSTEAVEIRELGRYGEVRVPHPAFVLALEWARRNGVPLEAVDPDEESYAEMFGTSVGYIELVRRTLRERRLLRSPPKTPDADGFVLAWDAQLNRGGGSRRLQRGRETLVAQRLRQLLEAHRPVACVLDRERIPPLLEALAQPARAG